MPRILSAAAAFPSYRYAQVEVRDALMSRWSGRFHDEEWKVFERAGVETRCLAFPLDYYFAGHGFGRRNADYVSQGLALGETALRESLERSEVSPGRIGHLIFVTTTGLSTPSLDALLASRLGLPTGALRTPIFGTGCAGGAVGLARAAEWLRGRPDALAAVLSVELCGQTFLPGDISKTGLVAAALFGDGAAACVLAGDAAAEERPGLEVVDSDSRLFPECIDLMGWEFVDEGFRLVLSPRAPAGILGTIAPEVGRFLADQGLAPEDVRHWFLHPGGPRILGAWRRALALPPQALRWTEEVLRGQGNLSSATVLVALERFLAQGLPDDGDSGVLAAVGPGFAAESLLLRWSGNGNGRRPRS